MALVGTFGVVLLVVTTLIHYEVLRMLAAGLPTLNMPARAIGARLWPSTLIVLIRHELIIANTAL